MELRNRTRYMTRLCCQSPQLIAILILLGMKLCFLHAHNDSLVREFAHNLDSSQIDFAQFDSHTFWSRGVEQSALIDGEDLNQTTASTNHPEWEEEYDYPFEGDLNLYYHYFHREGPIDRMLGFLACKLGIIVHGDVRQEQLALKLQNFDLKKLMQEGPYSPADLSLAAQQLIFDSLHDVDRVIDIHLHNLGYDEGNFLNPTASSQGLAKRNDYLTFLVLRYAAGMTTPLGSTHEARKRIHLYAAHFPKLCGFILPIHQAILPNGRSDWHNTGNYLTDKSALLTAKSFRTGHSDLFPAVSVHPFDPQWQKKLLEAHDKGIRLVKWMPPQSIPPDSDALDAYYEKIKELGMVLIAHAGPEHAIPTNEQNEQLADWGNPLRFRKALMAGVTLILAHCGHKDLIPDLDSPNQELVPGYELFLRLAKEAYQQHWSGKLYGDLAAVTTHYGPDFIAVLLQHAHEEGVRLLYGSDYPYTNLIKPQSDAYEICAKAGLLDPDKVSPLKEIRSWNPLLANYIFTRQIEWRMPSGEKIRFAKSTFTYEFPDGELELINRVQWEAFKNRS